jgi:hypothetical protein
MRSAFVSAYTAVLLGMACAGELLAQNTPNFQYIPGSQDPPLLYYKGQSRFSLNAVGTASIRDFWEGPVFGGEFRVAHAPTDRFGLVAGVQHYKLDRIEVSYTFGGPNPIVEEYRYQGTWNLVELGAGRFKKFRGNWIGEVYGLIGYGNTENIFPDGFRTRSNLVSASVQPIIGRASGFFEIAISNRIRFFNLTNIRTTGDPSNYFVDFDLMLMEQGPFLMWEPSLLLRGGWQRVRLSFQTGFSGDILGGTPGRLDLTVGLGLCLWLPGKRTQEVPEP